MTHRSDVSDEMLYAYVDGELDAAAAAQVEAAFALDSLLAARVAEQRALRGLLRARFDPVALEAVPDRLLQVAATAPSSVADIRVASARRTSARSGTRWAWREWGAMAATLVLGLVIGFGYQGRSGDQPLVTRDGNMLAAGFLAAALSDQLSGTAGGTAARIGLSIHASNGEYCRSFTVQPTTAGLACRRGKAWVVDVVARSTADAGQGEFRQAASSLPEAVRTAIEQRTSGEPLSSEEETAGIKTGWRMQPVPAGTP